MVANIRFFLFNLPFQSSYYPVTRLSSVEKITFLLIQKGAALSAALHEFVLTKQSLILSVGMRCHCGSKKMPSFVGIVARLFWG